jgi:N-acetylmuramoyl-L-alanine amidase
VNLRVSIALADLLRAAGARVWLTRIADTTLVAPPETLLANDLRARAAFADSVDAEVFLSVHHNADAGARHDVNETQTYYRTGDEGPSLDLAQAIHRRLVRGLRIGTDRLLPGNYAVLRQTRATAAVLGEPSHLTYPPVEDVLRQETSIRLEAESYYMGLLDYFGPGVPRIASIEWQREWRGTPALRPLVARVEGEVEGIAWTAGGTAAPAAAIVRRPIAGGAELVFAPAAPWRDGPLAVDLQVRNPRGNHSRRHRDTLDVDLPAERLVIHAWPESAGVGVVSLTARALDAWGRPLDDSLLAADVRWEVGDSPSSPRLLADRQRAGNGESRAYLHGAGAARVRVRWGGLEAERTFPAGSAASWQCGFVVRHGSETGIEGARVTIGEGARVVSTNPDGHFAVYAPGEAAGTIGVRAVAAGYYDAGPSGAAAARAPGAAAALDTVPTVRLVPFAGGALLGRRIALDAEGGGDESGGSGPDGLRAAGVNLAVARIARDYLERAGATVVLTRESDAPTPALLRVQNAERARAERLVRIGRRSGGPSAVGFFPGSAAGRGLAERLHQRLWRAEEDLAESASVRDSTATRRLPVLLEDAQYVLQQTASPAISARLGDLRSPADEERFLDPAWRHREAYEIFAALGEDLGAASDSTLRGATWTLLDSGRPVPGATVQVDGLTQVTDAEGRVRFSLLDGGSRHRVEARWPGDAAARSAWVLPDAWQWEREAPEPSRAPVR